MVNIVPELDYSKTALLVVDMQNDFVTGSLPVPGASEIIDPVNAWIQRFYDAKSTIIESFDWHPAKTPHFEKWPVHCVQRTVGASKVDGVLDYVGLNGETVIIIEKGLDEDDGYSVCSKPSNIVVFNEDDEYCMTDVAETLRTLDIKTVLVVGLALDYCVGESIKDLLDAGFFVLLDLAATRPVTKEGAKNMLAQFTGREIGYLNSTGEVIEYLTPPLTTEE